MLRLLVAIFMPWFLSTDIFADYPNINMNEINDRETRGFISDTLKQADGLVEDGTVSSTLNREREKIRNIDIHSTGTGVTLPKFIDAARDARYLEKAISASNRIMDSQSKSESISMPFVLVSFSMPESQIIALMNEAHSIGARVAIRGLVENDFKKTLLKFKSFSADGGLIIDPTLFSRFDITAVPTFILPLENVEQCSKLTCPVPDHVKAVGSATFHYFFDLVARTGEAKEQKQAKLWLAKVEGNQND